MDRKKSFMTGAIPGSANTIKGLQLFIGDLRASQHSKDQERRINSELVKIKQRFEESSHAGSNDRLDGYQRKKYVAKLIYIYITSNTTRLNDILFGLNQTLLLLKSRTFSEKFMGYLTLELLFEHEMVVNKIGEDLIPQLIADLSSNNDNFTGLALNFIGVVGNLTTIFAFDDELVSQVFQILRSPTSSQYLKKKSTLAFLNLLKSNLSILTDDLQRKQIWIQRIVSLLNDTDNFRVTLTTLPLVEYIAKYIDPSYCFRLISQLTNILYACIVDGTSDEMGKQFPLEYKFSNMPNPWLITKTVSLLNVLIVSSKETNNNSSQFLQASDIDQETIGKLRRCVLEAITLGTRNVSDPMERIVQNTVLFSLINFAPKLNPSDDAIVNSVNALCSLLNSPEINIRYLTLDSLIKLCSSTGKVAIDTVRFKNLDLILHLMTNEKDSSIVRKAVDLLYTFADSDNVKLIVENLLNFILHGKHITDPHMRSNIAVKIAILTEKYATDSNWYINISLRILLLTFSTSFNDDEIWHRLCQIVVNNPQLRKLTCYQLVDYLQEKQASEYIVKTAAFLLGEYAYLITDKITIEKLFDLFTEKYFVVSNITKAMILTTMVQLYKFSPDISSDVIKFFQLELNSLDIELQTRSYEYLKIIQVSKLSNNMGLLSLLFEPLPPFNTKSNPLLKRLGSLPTTVGDTTTAVTATSTGTSLSMPSRNSSPTKQRPAPPRSRGSTFSKSLDEHFPAASSSMSTSSVSLPNRYMQQRLSTNWREGYTRMLVHNQGIFYSSPLIKVIYRMVHLEPFHLRVLLTFVNQTEWDIAGLSTELIVSKLQDNPEYVLQNVGHPNVTTVQPHKRAELTFEIVIRKPFSVEESPIINIHFKCGSSTNDLSLKIGVGVTSTIQGSTAGDNINTHQQVTLPQFITRWKTLGEALGKEADFHIDDVPVRADNMRSQDGASVTNTLLGSLRQTMHRIGFDIVEQASVKNTLFLAGIVHSKTDGNFGCLLKLQCHENRRVNISCKTTQAGSLAFYVAQCVRETLI